MLAKTPQILLEVITQHIHWTVFRVFRNTDTFLWVTFLESLTIWDLRLHFVTLIWKHVRVPCQKLLWNLEEGNLNVSGASKGTSYSELFKALQGLFFPFLCLHANWHLTKYLDPHKFVIFGCLDMRINGLIVKRRKKLQIFNLTDLPSWNSAGCLSHLICVCRPPDVYDQIERSKLNCFPSSGKQNNVSSVDLA